MLLLSARLLAQQPVSFRVQELILPATLAAPENQCSGMCISGNYLYLLPENRFRDLAAAKLYQVALTDLDRSLADPAVPLAFEVCPVRGLDVLARRIALDGSRYEGLEALCMNGNTCYFSVETTTASPFCYLLKGRLRHGVIDMDTSLLLALPKPADKNSPYIYNAGFESVQLLSDKLYAFFEYNYFEQGNTMLVADTGLLLPPKQEAICAVPFRLTDITATDAGGWTALNYFYKGATDSAYRTKDPAAEQLIRDSSGYHGYCRLLQRNTNGKTICWDTLWTFPPEWRSYNWEGIAAYKGGYCIINDKYTAAPPYRTVLLYLSPSH